MGKIVYLMGKSSSGKDTIFKRLLHNEHISLRTVVLYTTRPIRVGEQNGVEYNFTDEEGYQELEKAGKVVEVRTYNTVMGPWRYFTVFEGQLELEKHNYLMIGTIESYLKSREYIGEEHIIPILIDLDDGERLQRALNRERGQEKPQYEEMCRRFLADQKDFSEENIQEAGITRRFINDSIEECERQILEYLEQELS